MSAPGPRGPSERSGAAAYRRAFLGWLALFVAFCAPFLAGRVVFPHDNARELGVAPAATEAADPEGARLANRFFSDLSSVYVPELAVHLNGERSSWIATWNPHVELGRPAGQLAGLGKAYWPTHLASFVFDDPVRALTWLTVLALFLAGAFAFLLLAELELGPLACWTGAVAASLGLYPVFWLTFGVYLWAVAWTFGLLWAVARYARRPDVGSALLVAFTVHSALLSAYPQALVWSAYLVAPFAVARILRLHAAPSRAKVLAGLALPVLLGVLSVAPVWADVLVETRRSARGDVNASYFLPSLPRLRGVASALGPLGQLVDPFRFGNPVDPDYAARAYKGTSLGPAFAALFVVALGGWRRTWGLWLLVAVALAMTLRPLIYLVGVEHLGLGISRFPPLAGVFVPLVLLVACGVERTCDPGLRRRGVWAALAGAPYALALLEPLVPWSRLGQGWDPPALAPGYVALGLVVTAGALAFVATRRAWIWVVVVAASTLVYGSRLALVRPRAEVHDTSPAVEALRTLTADGSRFLKVGARVRVLPPNQEAWLGLRSVHTYNSLVSREYREWIRRVHPEGMDLGHDGDWADYVEEGDYGRQFRRARSGGTLLGPELSWAGVGTVLSKGALDADEFEPVGGDLWRPRRPVKLEAQLVELPETLILAAPGGPLVVHQRLDELEALPVERVERHGDTLRFRTTATEHETTLFVSQQYHPSWGAFVTSGEGVGAELETVQLLELYQGVRLPPGTTEVELRFLPNVRYAWLPQLAFALAGGLVLLLAALRRRSASAPAPEEVPVR